MSRDNDYITYDQLNLHNTYSDGWISINGTVFDVTSFLSKHPGGDVFLGVLGTDCSGIFSTAHISNPDVEVSFIHDHRFLDKYSIKLIGALQTQTYKYHNSAQSTNELNEALINLNDRILYIKTDKDKLWCEIKQKIFEYLQKNKLSTKYSNFEGTMLILYYLSIYLILYYCSLTYGSYLFIILSAFNLTAANCNIAHASAHHGFTNNSVLNFIAKQFFDLSAGSWLIWQIEHISHHEAPHSPFDAQTSYTTPFLRLHSYKPYYQHYGYQYLYCWLIIAFYGPVQIIQSTHFVIKWCIKYNLYFALLIHLFFRCLFVYQFYVLGLKCLFVYLVSISYWTFFLLYAVHDTVKNVFIDTKINNYKHYRYSWAKVQILTAGNWYLTDQIPRLMRKWIQFHIGYFNYHIEHHLFPTFRYDLYPKLSPIITNMCNQHDIPYTSTTFRQLICSQQKDLKQKGKWIGRTD